jgi:amidophosphoribosyltransferase
MKHYCGLFGVVYNDNGNMQDIINGLNLLQHRGQDSAGISYIESNYEKIDTYKNLGLVKNIFDENLAMKRIKCGIGHVRYSTRVKTSLKRQIQEAQPFSFTVLLSNNKMKEHIYETFALGHNGNIPNISKLKEKYAILMSNEEETESDSYVLGKILQRFVSDQIFTSPQPHEEIPQNIWNDALIKFVNEIHGVYCLLVLTKFGIYVIKDSSAVRPICIAKFSDRIEMSSETVAISSNDYEFVRELKAGEIVFVGNNGEVVNIYSKPQTINTFCSFEYIYFFRHNSTFRGQNIEEIRFNLGQALAEQELLDLSIDEKSKKIPTIVVCVPQTSIASAKGFACKMNISYVDGIIKADNANRTFILPNDDERLNACKKKFIYNEELLKGKRIYLIDDSIVRGNTLKSVVEHLRTCAVVEIHVRIPSPPIISECYYGIDMSTKKELLAYNHTVDKMIEILDVDSLTYLDIERMKKVFSKGDSETHVCTSCFTGKYDSELLDW